MYIVIILLSIALIACGITAWFYAKQTKCHRMDIDRLKDINKELEEFRTSTSAKLEIVGNLINDKNAELGAANRLIEQTTSLVAAKEDENVSLRNKIDELREQLNQLHLSESKNESIEKMESVIKELDENYRIKNANYMELETAYSTKVEDLQALNDQIEQVKGCILTGQNEAAWLETTKDSLRKEISDLRDVLDDLKRLHNEVVVRERASEAKGWRLTCDAKESRLVKLIDELVGLCPELEKDLKGIGWKRVWLPKLQDLCNREGLDKVCGIYRIRLVDDEGICYIGQAVNVKERWYTHVKKMVGAEVKGSEKLYEYRPDELVWEVVEEVGRDKLDEREKYWIDWWGCKEIGLNKKR